MTDTPDPLDGSDTAEASGSPAPPDTVDGADAGTGESIGVTMVPYDEFGLFHENAEEYGLPWTGPPTVRRESVALADGRRLSALVWGTGTPEVVLLHGGAQNAHTWDTVALALQPRPLLAIDLPGHGHADGPAEPVEIGRSPAGAAADVATVIDALAPSAALVVGMSYGGLTAVALADARPDLVRSLLLVDVVPGVRSDRSRHIADFVAGPRVFADLDELLARTMQFNPTRRMSSLRRGILHNAVQLDDGTWMWRHARWRPEVAAETAPEASSPAAASGASSTPDRLFEELADALGRVRVPITLARGLRDDSVLRDDDEAELRERQPDARVVHFAEAGHSIQGDMPVELAELIAELLG